MLHINAQFDLMIGLKIRKRLIPVNKNKYITEKTYY